MVTLIQDDIIYDMQRKGGVSRYWDQLSKEFNCYENLAIVKKKTDNKFKYIRNNFPEITTKSIFHSSYYFCYDNKNIKSVLTIHDFMPEKYWKGFSKYKHLLMKRLALKRASYLVFINEHLVDEFREFYPEFGYLPYSVIKHGNSFEANLFCAKQDANFIYIGSLGDAKNLKFALNYFIENQDKKLKCIGFSRDDFNKYCKLASIDHTKLVNVVVLGCVNDETLIDQVRQSTALIIPSFDEGFGLPAVEAISLGIPVLASNIPSFKSLLPQEYLLDIEDEAASFKIINDLADNVELRIEVFIKQEKMICQLSWKKAADQYYEIYRELYDSF